METPRKVQVTGRNTFIVSLPREWVEKRNISRGDPIYLAEKSDGTISISTKQEKKELKKYVIHVTEDRATVIRNIISAYIGGAGKIVLKGKQVNTVAETIRRILSGVEIINENEEEIELGVQSFDNLDIDGVLRREFNVTKSMFSLVSQVCNGDEDAITEITKKEQEVDRLFILLLRDLVISGRSQKENIFRAIVAKSIEKIGDHLVDLSKNAANAGINPWLAEMIHSAGETYYAAFETFAISDLDEGKYRSAKAKYLENYKKVNNLLKKEKDQTKMFIFLLLLEKCNKIVRYSEDIIESNTDIIFTNMSGEDNDGK